ncbi:hypothetical protein [Chlorobium ferrooxidans]|uniref:hypothetical protein n=1 Tax=Chlorobium ferrooxidans TaxID=84205 RepID=UPI00031D3085|nr:hypothetical protein [Chlorobium ferrooxidans]
MKNVRSTAGRLMKNKPLSVFLFLLLLLALFVFMQRREPKKVESKLFFDRIPVSVTRNFQSGSQRQPEHDRYG